MVMVSLQFSIDLQFCFFNSMIFSWVTPVLYVFMFLYRILLLLLYQAQGLLNTVVVSCFRRSDVLMDNID